MHCPECNSFMNTFHIEYESGSITTEACSHCGGTFYDSKELKTHLDKNTNTNPSEIQIDRGDFEMDHKGKIYSCPSCETSMQEKVYLYDSGIHFDFCPECHGIFLNKGEFNEIERYVDSIELSKEGKKMELLGEHLGKIVNNNQEISVHEKIQWDNDISLDAYIRTNPASRLELTTKFVIDNLL